MNAAAPTYYGRLIPDINLPGLSSSKLSTKSFRFCGASSLTEASHNIPAAPILLPEGPWKQSPGKLLKFECFLWIPGGVTAAEGFRAAGMFGGLRANRDKPNVPLVVCDVDAISAGSFTTNIVAAAPVEHCRKARKMTETVK